MVSFWDLITVLMNTSHQYFTSIMESFLTTPIGVKSYCFYFCIFLFQNLKHVVQTPIGGFVIS